MQLLCEDFRLTGGWLSELGDLSFDPGPSSKATPLSALSPHPLLCKVLLTVPQGIGFWHMGCFLLCPVSSCPLWSLFLSLSCTLTPSSGFRTHCHCVRWDCWRDLPPPEAEMCTLHLPGPHIATVLGCLQMFPRDQARVPRPGPPSLPFPDPLPTPPECSLGPRPKTSFSHFHTGPHQGPPPGNPASERKIQEGSTL